MTKATVEVDSREELKELFRLDEPMDIPDEFRHIVQDMIDVLDYLEAEGEASHQFIKQHIDATHEEQTRGMLLTLQAYGFVENDGKMWRLQ